MATTRGGTGRRRALSDARVTVHVRAVHADSRQTYGRLRRQRALRTRGIRIGDKRVRRLMRAAGLHARGRRRFRVTTERAAGGPTIANRLARRFTVAHVNRVWAADITAIPTATAWCYLAVVLDLASRRVVGWATDTTLETGLVITALQRALVTRRILPGLLHHSDQGVQYASDAYQRLLAAHGIIPSMSRVGDGWDNAPVESFFSRLKTEGRPERGWGTYEGACAALADHIDFYNRTRLHSAIGYRSPVDYETNRRVSL